MFLKGAYCKQMRLCVEESPNYRYNPRPFRVCASFFLALFIMSQFFSIHPDNPQQRLISQAVEIIRKGGVVAYPTDTTYALGCRIGDKQPLERIRRLRRLDEKHLYTMMCRDLSELGVYARVSNQVFRQLKAHTPGAYTFILEATKEVPRRLQSGKRKQIGLRVPDNRILQAILDTLDEPILNTTLILPDDEYPLIDPYDIRDVLEHQVDLVIDGGYGGLEETTVVDLSAEIPELIRQGLGDFAGFS